MKSLIVYWSGTGNTEKMAELIEIGMKKEGSEVTIMSVNDADKDDIYNYDIIVLGCPSMGAEELEDSYMQPYYNSIKDNIVNRNIALFGSYGWGDGEWMRTWEADVKEQKANLLTGSGLIMNETPVGDDEEICINFGKELIKAF